MNDISLGLRQLLEEIENRMYGVHISFEITLISLHKANGKNDNNKMVEMKNKSRKF